LESMPVARTGLPPLSSVLWSPLTNVCHILNMAARFAEAEPYAREADAINDKASLPEVDPRRAQTLVELGTALRGERKEREGRTTLDRALKIYEQLGPIWVSSAQRVRHDLATDGASAAPPKVK
jgi:hypothetical protein